MKLSDLELLVVSMRAQSQPGADPDVTFWKARTARDPAPLVGECDTFMEFDFSADRSNMAWDHKVVATSAKVRMQKGDFNLPIVSIPFYKTL